LEENSRAPEVLLELKKYVQLAHDDVRRHLAMLAGASLDPLSQGGSPIPLGYPWMLDALTLQGYLGEVLAGLVAEYFEPFRLSWLVPAYLFRFHHVAFDELERWRQGGPAPGRIPGRFGDDFLAFGRRADGAIERTLVGEAKCTSKHSRAMIREAHTQISDSASRPVSVLRVIEVLRDRNDQAASDWILALQRFINAIENGVERFDMVVYVCGQRPRRRPSWIRSERPVAEYSAGRRLESVEVHVSDVKPLVDEVYQRKADWCD
jgi:hypothetical protein